MIYQLATAYHEYKNLNNKYLELESSHVELLTDQKVSRETIFAIHEQDSKILFTFDMLSEIFLKFSAKILSQ